MQEPCVGVVSVTITSASTAAIEIRCALPAVPFKLPSCMTLFQCSSNKIVKEF